MEDYLIIVDENDTELGKAEKNLVHKQGLLHRAFSIFIFNSKGELLLQQRAIDKYHSGGLWTNTCCSHPRYGEETQQAVTRRMNEEMGLSCDTHFAFSFTYKAQFNNGLTEYEFDHVYIGFSDALPNLNPEEAKDWKYMSLGILATAIQDHPEHYTEWLKVCLPQVMQYMHTHHFQLG
jgi:isopentenyl-diphosphate Delta-isomerase